MSSTSWLTFLLGGAMVIGGVVVTQRICGGAVAGS